MSSQVTIFTAVYNTEKFLPQCLDSVINQTYRSFTHIVVDNGCTDGCTEILREYASRYPWVRLIRFDENRHDYSYADWIDTPYFCSLDSDDWWEPDMLEKMVSFLEEHNLDLALTGTVNYFEATCTEHILRKLEQPVFLTQRQFAQQYPMYWTFPSAAWASLKKTALYRKAWKEIFQYERYPYGTDTIGMLAYIKQCENIGIDNSVLYHYRIHKKSVTFQYNPRRFDANVFCYERLKDFMELHQTFDIHKQEWLKRVHLSSMNATLELLWKAALPDHEKFSECVRIAADPLTSLSLTCYCDERAQWIGWVTAFAAKAVLQDQIPDADEWISVLKITSPRCYSCVQPENLELFKKESGLLHALLKDDRGEMIRLIMELVVQKSYSKQYNLGALLHGLIPESSLLFSVTDTRFFREYANSCMLILREAYHDALEEMTGILLENKKKYARELFVQIYLSLAALENQAEAFVFGKLRLAQFYLRQERYSECRSLVSELKEMGFVDNEELSALCSALPAEAN